jgi:hypothetical protein
MNCHSWLFSSYTKEHKSQQWPFWRYFVHFVFWWLISKHTTLGLNTNFNKNKLSDSLLTPFDYLLTIYDALVWFNYSVWLSEVGRFGCNKWQRVMCYLCSCESPSEGPTLFTLFYKEIEICLDIIHIACIQTNQA